MEIAVGMGEIQVTQSPHLLMAVGIGSCIAVALYDRDTRIGGLAHIMLPYIEEAKDKSHPDRFADVGIGGIMDKIKKQGGSIQDLKAKIFGGANMFPEIISSHTNMDIGRKNILAVREELEKNNIEIIAEEVGDHIGRTVSFNTEDGSVIVKSAKLEQRKY